MEKIDSTDLKDRVDSFVKRYGELVEEFHVDFANYPVFIPDGGGGFRVIIQNTPVDTTSNFVEKDV